MVTGPIKVRRRSHDAEAVRWTAGVPFPDLTELQTEIHYSEDKSLYYVSRPGDNRSRAWLSVTPIEPSPADKSATKGLFNPGLAQFTTAPGVSHWRKVWDFSLFKVRSGPVEPLDEGTDLYLDYAAVSGWPAARTPEAVIGRGTSGAQIVKDGHWIVTTAGTVAVLTPSEFHERYEVPLTAA